MVQRTHRTGTRSPTERTMRDSGFRDQSKFGEGTTTDNHNEAYTVSHSEFNSTLAGVPEVSIRAVDGILNQKVLPLPDWLSTPMVP